MPGGAAKNGNEAQRHSSPQGMTTGPSQDTTRYPEGGTSKQIYWTRKPQRNNQGGGRRRGGEREDAANKRATPHQPKTARNQHTKQTTTDKHNQRQGRHATQLKLNRTNQKHQDKTSLEPDKGGRGKVTKAPCSYTAKKLDMTNRRQHWSEKPRQVKSPN